ncbi:hypothetical protein Tco_1578719 [Tanacetum coccineum]
MNPLVPESKAKLKLYPMIHAESKSLNLVSVILGQHTLRSAAKHRTSAPLTKMNLTADPDQWINPLFLVTDLVSEPRAWD